MLFFKKILYYVFGSIGYLGYFLGHVAIPVLVVPFAIILIPLPKRLRAAILKTVFLSYVTFITRIYLPMLRSYRIVPVEGLERARAAGPAVYVANHRSRLDAPLLLSLIQTTTVLIKSTYADNPLFAGFVKFFAFIAVDQNSLSSLATALDKAKKLVAEGKSILIFPEGTRAPSGRVLPFKDIAFRIAAATNTPVIPTVIHTNLPVMAKRPGSIFPGKFTFTIRFLPPMKAQENERPSAFADRAWLIITKELKTLDKGTAWEIF